MAAVQSPVLELDGITKTFKDRRNGEVTALRNVSLALFAGKCVGLVGASGSGKSTLARVMMQLLTPDEGTIRFNGEPLPKKLSSVQELDYRKHVQMIFQDPFASLNQVHTVAYHLRRALLRHDLVKKNELQPALKALLERVGLAPAEAYLSKKPFALSGGQRQRVAIARALAVAPRVVVADEPTSMLDVSIRAGVLRLLNELKEAQQLSMLLITHDLASARYLCDTICVINEGRIVERGETDKILNAPEHPYTQKLLSALPQLPTHE
ncbi:MAG: dipeptide/oligopeptide/nickel ABC transporter ATP-binding protein [Myxococcales bacterium]|nr:dipeptide/oligopeptide/nickel ABC transporter ATP-binding protein [Myxococcales bacterium]